MASSIFNLPPPPNTPKIQYTKSLLPPTWLDTSQPPQKAPPFRQCHAHPFIRTLQICTTKSGYQTLFPDSSLTTPPAQLTYAKFIAPLAEILLNYDLRTTASIIAAPSDVSMHLHAGTLTLDMPHAIHAKCAFPSATAHPSGGRKHHKPSLRYRVEFDLRAPGMVSGKPGFERLLKAAREVSGLSEARCWLAKSVPAMCHPTVVSTGSVSECQARVDFRIEDEDDLYDVSERLGEMFLQCPTEGDDVVQLRYEGLVNSEDVVRIVIEMVQRSRKTVVDWVAVSVKCHATGGSDGFVVLLQNREDGQDGGDEGDVAQDGGLRYISCFEYLDSSVT